MNKYELKEIIAKRKTDIRNEISDYYEGQNVAFEYALDFIDQLDEPEKVVVPAFVGEWLETCKVPKSLYGALQGQEGNDKLNDWLFSASNQAVFARAYLEDCEVELPVIPEFVAEWIEEAKRNEGWGIVGFINSFGNGIIQAPFKTRKYFDENQRNVILAYLDGYTVEEQKYYVLDSEDIPLLERVNNQIYKTVTALSIHEDGRDNSRFELTEEEIKDYDKRFWPFAIPVEEDNQ